MGQSSAVRSIADLAKIAGVSISTVSRALTGKGTLNPETRERIRALAASHEFQLNVAAQNLRLGRTGSVAVLLPLGHERGHNLSDPFFSAMLGCLADALSERGYDLLLRRVLPDTEDWLDVFVRSGRADGVIVIGQSDQSAVLDRVAQHYQPIVVWGALDATSACTTVGTNNREGGALAARHLLERGRTRLAFFGQSDAPEFVARQEGFLDALPDDIRKQVGLVPIPLTPDGSYSAAHAWLSAGNRPDGVFATSDIIAMNVVAAATDLGIAVPQDLAVIGFDDLPLSQLSKPPLTTVRQDIEGGARKLVELVFQRMTGEYTRSVQFPPKLIVRQST